MLDEQDLFSIVLFKYFLSKLNDSHVSCCEFQNLCCYRPLHSSSKQVNVNLKKSRDMPNETTDDAWFQSIVIPIMLLYTENR